MAAAQHGVVSLEQLAGLGASGSAVRGWVARGLLLRLHQGVFAVGHAALPAAGRFLAAVLACGPGAVLSHVSAAALQRIRASAAGRIDVTVPTRVGRSRPGLRIHDGRHLLPDEVTLEQGVPCTSVARTLLDLAAVLDRRGIQAAVESAERLQLFDLRQLTFLLGRHHGRRGTARLREVLAEFDPEVLRARSELEARFYHLCADYGLPLPLVNRAIEAGGHSFEVDFHWPAARLIVETDGASVHGTTAARRRDAERDRLLGATGWEVCRCGWTEAVVEPEPLVVGLRRRLAGISAAR